MQAFKTFADTMVSTSKPTRARPAYPSAASVASYTIKNMFMQPLTAAVFMLACTPLYDAAERTYKDSALWEGDERMFFTAAFITVKVRSTHGACGITSSTALSALSLVYVRVLVTCTRTRMNVWHDVCLYALVAKHSFA